MRLPFFKELKITTLALQIKSLQKQKCGSRSNPKPTHFSYLSQSLPYLSQDIFRSYEESEHWKTDSSTWNKKKNLNSSHPSSPCRIFDPV